MDFDWHCAVFADGYDVNIVKIKETRRRRSLYSPCVAWPARKPTGEAYGSADGHLTTPTADSYVQKTCNTFVQQQRI